MYQLLSPQIIVENIVALASPYIQNKKKLDSPSLKKAYCDYLQSIQPYCPLIHNNQLFYSDSETENLFSDYFSDSEIDMAEIYEKINLDAVMYPIANDRLNILKKSFSHIEKIDPTFCDVFRLVMNTVFCTVTKNLGGTSVNPKYIGVMCAHHDMQSEEDVIPELFTHEFTHNAILIDEHRYGHYKNYESLKDPETYIDATDRGMHFKLPLNRILHSMLVAVEIIKLRDAFIGHQPRINQHVVTDQLIARDKKYIKTIEENKKIKNLFTDRGCYLYELVKNFYQ